MDRVAEVAAKRGVLPAQVALAWLLRQPGVTSPIVGVTRLDQLEQLIGALGVDLSEGESEYLEEPYVPHPVLGH